MFDGGSAERAGAKPRPAVRPRRMRNSSGHPPLSFARRADVAQLVEHFTRNEGVPGSSPGVGSSESPANAAGFCVPRTAARTGICPRICPERRSIAAMPVEPSGHVFRVERSAGRSGTRSTACRTAARCSAGSGRRGRSAGVRRRATFTKRRPRRGCATCSTRRAAARCPGMVRTGATFADAAAEWLRYVEHERDRKPSTVARLPRARRVAAPAARSATSRSRTITTPMIEAWLRGVDRSRQRTRNKALVAPARDLPAGAQACTGCRSTRWPTSRSRAQRRERRHRGVLARGGPGAGPRGRRSSRTRRSTSPRRSRACAAASCSRCAGATSTSPVRRSASARATPTGALTTPKSGKVRSVPMAPDVATALAALGQRERLDRRRRPRLRRDASARYLDGSALRRRYLDGAQARRPAAAALPRPAPHVRHADDRQGRHPPRAGVDGPRRRPDDDEVPALRPAPEDAALVAEAFAPEIRPSPPTNASSSAREGDRTAPAAVSGINRKSSSRQVDDLR